MSITFFYQQIPGDADKNLRATIKLSVLNLVPPCELTENGGCDQTCTDNGDVAECSCRAPDFKLGSDGKSCEKVHPCDKPDNGGCSDKCEKEGDKAKCSCNDGRELTSDGKKCKDSKSIN